MTPQGHSPDGGIAAEALRRVVSETGTRARPDPADLAALGAACGADPERCKRWVKRLVSGEPLAHVLGHFHFRGLRFVVDKRAYVTDPEVSNLVDLVAARVPVLRDGLGREPLLAEVGVGCGALAISLSKAVPGVNIVGLELDSDALALAAANTAAHASPLRLVESDLFDSWPPELPAPDLVYGDPPWGEPGDLYGADRPTSHYVAMPPSSAFPLGGPTAGHTQVIAAAARRGWTCEIWLNGGVLEPAMLTAAASGAREAEVLRPAPGISVLRCRAL